MTLHLDGAGPQRGRRNSTTGRPARTSHARRLSLLSIFAVSVMALGQTFAANININTNQGTEFGQGFQAFTACAGDTALNLRAGTSFTNGGQSGDFFLKTITVDNVPASCSGLDLTIKAFGSGGGALSLYGGNQSAAVAHMDGANFTKGPGTGYTVTGSSGSFVITFAVPVGLAGDIRKFTVESGEHIALNCLNGGVCTLGDTGPGGGTIFFASNSTFSVPGSECGDNCKYLEYAPRSWGDGIPVAAGESSGSATEWPALKWCVGTGATNNVTSVVSQNESAMMTSTFGQGFAATSAIGTNCVSGAGKTVADLVFGGKSDWFLPSFSEMHQLCKYIRGSAGVGTITTTCAGGSLPSLFPNTHYWTSTESPETPGQAAWLFFLGTPDPDDDLKGFAGRTVPIRAFS